jgi:hypothetical protein
VYIVCEKWAAGSKVEIDGHTRTQTYKRDYLKSLVSPFIGKEGSLKIVCSCRID